LLNQRLTLLSDPTHLPLLGQGLRGIERETLRVTAQGHLALTPHPADLGSALTHEKITTDYSESLLEFITPACHDVVDALRCLDEIHRFTYQRLGDESMWHASMPCILPEETRIPIAWYGQSHIGMLKHVYRRGLALRYGKAMQCIAGLHYNFSINEAVWELMRQQEIGASANISARDYQSERYIGVVRNFRRYSWLLMYLFGASPALASNFLAGRTHQLETLSDDTLYLPYATSLRMSDLGYQSNAQASITPYYNHLDGYIHSLTEAVSQPYPAYEAIGIKQQGEWVQLNTNILQIENEYYATIRPKRTIHSGERPIPALRKRGVQYVEVRCLDIDPFDGLGISLETARFMDVFLHYIALEDSPIMAHEEGQACTHNFALTVKQGRQPGLQLERDGVKVDLKEWGLSLLDRMQAVADLLDQQLGGAAHSEALAAQRAKLHDVALTPSARVLEGVRAAGSYVGFTLSQSQRAQAALKSRPLDSEKNTHFEALAQASIAAQAAIEAADTGSFDEFVTAYNASLTN
jgi:glutamate--cysteine ligase